MGARSAMDPSLHRQLAAQLFNHVWSLLDKSQRTAEDYLEMIHAAHASRYHWGIVGTAKEWSVGEWQISQVYAVLNRPEPAAYHADRSLKFAQNPGVGAFYVGYAYEALARAHSLSGDQPEYDRCLADAKSLLDKIEDAEERKTLADDLASLARP